MQFAGDDCPKAYRYHSTPLVLTVSAMRHSPQSKFLAREGPANSGMAFHKDNRQAIPGRRSLSFEYRVAWQTPVSQNPN
jgi:hypothetical protein